jgi:hypothetical protein
VPLRLSVIDGQLQPVSQMKDYANRGLSLEDLSFWEFVRDTYNGFKLTSASDNRRTLHVSDRSIFVNDTGEAAKCRVIRKKGHKVIVDFVGPWIPRNDNADDYSMYCATMLTLLVSWRNIKTIHQRSPSLEAEFDKFLAVARPDQLRFMKNAQYYYESSDRVRQQRKDKHNVVQPIEVENLIQEEDEEPIDMEGFEELMVTEEDIEYAIEHPFGPEEHIFAQVGMNIATDVGIFPEGPIYTQTDVQRKKIS